MPLAVSLALAYIAGCLAAPYIPLLLGRSLALAATSILLALSAYFWSRRRRGATLIIWLLFFLVGVVAMNQAYREAISPLVHYRGEAVRLAGVVSEDPSVKGDRVTYLLQVGEAEFAGKRWRGGKVLVRVTSPTRVYAYGDVLEVEGRIAYPSPPGQPGESDYRRYLWQQKILALVRARPEGISKVGEAGRNPLMSLALKSKERLRRTLTTIFSPRESALLQGMLLGSRDRLDPALEEALAETGLIYLLCVSGLQVGFVLSACLLLARYLRWSRGVTMTLGFVLLLFYDFVVGFNPPMVRASIMAVLLLLAHYLGRHRDWRVALAVAAMVVLLANPLALYNTGFQLSFAATWGILFLGPGINQWWKTKWATTRFSGVGAYGWWLAVPLGAELGVLPLIAWHFGLVSMVSLVANIVTMPLLPVIFLGGALAGGLGSVFLPLGQALAWVVSPLIHCLLFLVQELDKLPWVALYRPPPPLFLVFSWYPALWLIAKGRRWRWVGAVLLSLLWLLLVTGGGGNKESAWLRLDFLDVGRGDSVLVRTPGGRTMLVNAGGWAGELGGNKEGAGLKVVRYLRHQGIRELDVLVITHPGEEHCAGAWAVLRRFPVRLVAVPYLPDAGDVDALLQLRGKDIALGDYARLLAFAHSRGARISYIRGGDRLRLDPAVDICCLEVADLPSTRGVALQLTCGECRFLLLTGAGTGPAAWGSLLATSGTEVCFLPVPKSSVSLEWLQQGKAPHHLVFSASEELSSSLLSSLKPLELQGTKIWCTGKDGVVTLVTDGDSVSGKSWRAERGGKDR
ncbi:ComEC/Rec2 family competence protein [Desulfothermobacter acidiphilus]|uniref:ComEC/Rec2 family competence protein n=1 Tax=Desulfothermobacter acidiphilus TaxID=1938353 RepID=UPI003F8BDE84